METWDGLMLSEGRPDAGETAAPALPAEPTGGAAEVVRLADAEQVVITVPQGSAGDPALTSDSGVGTPVGVIFVENGSALVYLSVETIFDVGWMGLWLVVAALPIGLGALGIWMLARFRWVARNPRTPGVVYCRACNYPAAGIDGGRCPECGRGLNSKNTVVGRAGWRRVLWPVIGTMVIGGMWLGARTAFQWAARRGISPGVIWPVPELDRWMTARGIWQPQASKVTATKIIRFDPATNERRLLGFSSNGYLGVKPTLGHDPSTLVVPNGIDGAALIEVGTGRRLGTIRSPIVAGESWLEPQVLLSADGAGVEMMRNFSDRGVVEWVRWDMRNGQTEVLRTLEPNVQMTGNGSRLTYPPWVVQIPGASGVGAKERWLLTRAFPGDDLSLRNTGTSRIELCEEGAAAPSWALVMERMAGGTQVAAGAPVVSMEGFDRATAPIVGVGRDGEVWVWALGIEGSAYVRVIALDSEGKRALVVWRTLPGLDDSGIDRAGVVDLERRVMKRELALDRPIVRRGALGPQGRVVLVLLDPVTGQTLETWGPEDDRHK